MRVLNVNDIFDPIAGGGTAERTFQMSRALVKAGIECTVLTTDVGLTSERVDQAKPVKVVACRSLSKRFFIPRFSYRHLKEVVQSADVVHLMGHWSLLNAIVYIIAVRLGKPYVVCPAGALPIYGRSKWLKRIYNCIIGRRLMRNARFCIAVTSAEIPDMQRYGVALERIEVIPNGIAREQVPSAEPERFRDRHGLGAAPIILFLGRLNHIKGPDLLLRAFCNVRHECKEYQLVFAGPDGGMLASLKEMAQDEKVSDRVRFIGFVGGAEKYQACYAASLLVIPSRQEAMSIVVLEGGVTGTPVLLTDQCGFPEVDEHGGGQVVEASVAALERGLTHMLRDSGTLREKGAALKAYIEKKFLWDSLAPLYVALYRRCV